jgi:hypothetical protein
MEFKSSEDSLVFPKPLFKYLETVGVFTIVQTTFFYQTGYYQKDIPLIWSNKFQQSACN